MEEDELNHPNHWYNRAADLHASAGAVWDAMTNDPRDTSKRLGFTEGHSMQVACQPVYLMLCGLSLEVVMKAVLVQRGEMSSKHEHHRIVDLSIAVGRGLSGILCLRHNMLPRRVYASQTESPAGGSAGDSGRTA
ncbi:hypothetical protein EN871_32200 [bacterium M00.F.Ca.ET.228.01.1.1]|nr:hypothetical protein EN871_32200 [bacterium M00.F.Ca.ET.228.01.1.1]TGR95274.1 hypothetical protein EN834_32185 [bacterium M00.F.Ca.ET.191.01.1.1]TGT96123.1 hypothetical protein EN798_32195 [bacterium M00.F.Ca.ET.155.01.1.1]